MRDGDSSDLGKQQYNKDSHLLQLGKLRPREGMCQINRLKCSLLGSGLFLQPPPWVDGQRRRREGGEREGREVVLTVDLQLERELDLVVLVEGSHSIVAGF